MFKPINEDYALAGEDVGGRTNEILEDLNITNYDNVDKILNQPEMTPQKTRSYLNKIIATAHFRRNQLKGYKARVTHAYKKGEIGGVERARENKRIDDARVVLNEYIDYHENWAKQIKGFGIGGKRGGNWIFFLITPKLC